MTSAMPAALQRRDFGGADQRALFEHEAALADGMHDDGAVRVRGRHRSEFHDAALYRREDWRRPLRAAAR